MEKCPNCGAPLENGICMYCKTIVNENEQTIPQEEIHVKERIEREVREYRQVSTKRKTLTVILVIFFGYFGFHSFYAGKIGRGLLYFCTLGLFMLGWFYDIFLVLSNHFTDKEGNVIKKG